MGTSFTLVLLKKSVPKVFALGILETCMIETLKLRIHEDPTVSLVVGMCNL